MTAVKWYDPTLHGDRGPREGNDIPITTQLIRDLTGNIIQVCWIPDTVPFNCSPVLAS